MIERVSALPGVIEQCARAARAAQLVHYLRDLANDFHTYYNAHQFIVEDAALRDARLDLALATQTRDPQRSGVAGCFRARDDVTPPWPATRHATTKPKRGRTTGFSGWMGLLCGLALGLAVAARGVPQGSSARRARWPTSAAKSRQESAPRNEPVDAEARRCRRRGSGEALDFYDMLPKFEVVVPEKDKDVTARHQVGRPRRAAAPMCCKPARSRISPTPIACVRSSRCRASNPRFRKSRSTTIPGTACASDRSKLDELNRTARKCCASRDVDVLVIRVGD